MAHSNKSNGKFRHEAGTIFLNTALAMLVRHDAHEAKAEASIAKLQEWSLSVFYCPILRGGDPYPS